MRDSPPNPDEGMRAPTDVGGHQATLEAQCPAIEAGNSGIAAPTPLLRQAGISRLQQIGEETLHLLSVHAISPVAAGGAAPAPSGASISVSIRCATPNQAKAWL